MKEKCIRCGVETEYNVSTPVTMRRWYIEGSGQLCPNCFFTLYPVPTSLQSNLGEDYTPNDNPPIIPNKL